MNRMELTKKLGDIISELLMEKGYVAFIDVFEKLDYLDPEDYRKWRMKQIPYLERAIKVNLVRINFIMKTVRRTCLNNHLKPSFTGYKSWGKRRKMELRFSKSGLEPIEKTYATHFVSIPQPHPLDASTIPARHSNSDRHP